MSKAEKELTGDFDIEDPAGYEDADSLLGTPVKSVSFAEIGASVTGEVLTVETGDQRDPDGTVRTFPNGDVRRQVILTLQTEEAEDDDDDGQRRLFIKGFMVKAFRDAVRRADVKGIRPGGRVTVRYRADGEPTAKGMNPPKLFDVTYDAP